MINHICTYLITFDLLLSFDELFMCYSNCFQCTDAQPGAESEGPPADGAERLLENEAAPEAGAEGINHWWGIVKEIQMIVFGFITPLLPGFHNIDHA